MGGPKPPLLLFLLGANATSMLQERRAAVCFAVLKVLMDLISRVLIFFTFMIVHSEGKFSPMRALTSFYTMVGIMIIFNVVLNERRNFCSINYWLGEL